MAENKREQLYWFIFSSILLNGIETTKGVGENPIEEKVYTKRLNVGKNYGEGANAVEVVYVSLTSGGNDWDDMKKKALKIKNVRINCKNSNGEWCNIFINEAPTEMLEFISNNIPSGVKF